VSVRHLTPTQNIPSYLPGCPTQTNLCICCNLPGQVMQGDDKTTLLKPGFLTLHRQYTSKVTDCWQPCLFNQQPSSWCTWTERIAFVLPKTQRHSVQGATAHQERPELSTVTIWLQRWYGLNTNISFSPPSLSPTWVSSWLCISKKNRHSDNAYVYWIILLFDSSTAPHFLHQDAIQNHDLLLFCLPN